MSTLEGIPGIESFIRCKVIQDRQTHRQLSNMLKQMYPSMRGLSAANVKRFCKAHYIHRTSRLSDSQLDTAVRLCVGKVSDLSSSLSCPTAKPLAWIMCGNSDVDNHRYVLDVDPMINFHPSVVNGAILVT